MKLRLSLAGALLLTPALGLLSAAPAGAAESSVDADFACTSVTVSSDRHDLSNVVLRFADGDQKFEGLEGKTATFSGTGAFAGDRIEAVFIKAGSNASGQGPGYGERVDAPEHSCGTAATSTPADQPKDAPKGSDAQGGHTKGTDAGGDAVVDAVVSCDGTSVVVTSTKDLSNVVLVLSDGTHVKHEGLSGHERTFTAPAGTTIVAAYVKSGANHSDDGPGYGQRVDAKPCETVTPAVVTTPVLSTPVVNTPIVPAAVAPAAILAAAEVAPAPAAEAPAAHAAEVAAAAAPAEAHVLGVALERSAPAGTVAAAGLARTGIELTTMLLVAVSLLLGGILLTRRGAAKRSA